MSFFLSSSLKRHADILGALGSLVIRWSSMEVSQPAEEAMIGVYFISGMFHSVSSSAKSAFPSSTFDPRLRRSLSTIELFLELVVRFDQTELLL